MYPHAEQLPEPRIARRALVAGLLLHAQGRRSSTPRREANAPCEYARPSQGGVSWGDEYGTGQGECGDSRERAVEEFGKEAWFGVLGVASKPWWGRTVRRQGKRRGAGGAAGHREGRRVERGRGRGEDDECRGAHRAGGGHVESFAGIFSETAFWGGIGAIYWGFAELIETSVSGTLVFFQARAAFLFSAASEPSRILR